MAIKGSDIKFVIIAIQFYLMYMEFAFFFTNKGGVLRDGMF